MQQQLAGRVSAQRFVERGLEDHAHAVLPDHETRGSNELVEAQQQDGGLSEPELVRALEARRAQGA